MRFLILTVLLAAFCAPGSVADVATGTALAKDQRFAPVADLAGRCWTALLTDRDARDVHCYEWAIADRFLRDRHHLTGPDGVYQGETLYGWDSQTRILRYWYFNSLGGVSEGTVELRGEEWMFLETYRGAEGSMELRTVFRREGEDGYSVDTEAFRDGAWQPFGSLRFKTSGMASARPENPAGSDLP